MKAVPVLMALLLIGLAVPLILQKVPPNGFYGFRLPKTQSDPRIWYAANRGAGVNLAVGSAISLLVWTVTLAASGPARANVVGMSTLVVAVLCGFVLSLVQLHRM